MRVILKFTESKDFILKSLGIRYDCVAPNITKKMPA